jgi:hypothetical protein
LNAAPRVEIANGILFSEALAAEGAVVFAKACELALPFGLKESAEQLARSLWRALEGSAACSAASGSAMKPRARRQGWRGAAQGGTAWRVSDNSVL